LRHDLLAFHFLLRIVIIRTVYSFVIVFSFFYHYFAFSYLRAFYFGPKFSVGHLVTRILYDHDLLFYSKCNVFGKCLFLRIWQWQSSCVSDHSRLRCPTFPHLWRCNVLFHIDCINAWLDFCCGVYFVGPLTFSSALAPTYDSFL